MGTQAIDTPDSKRSGAFGKGFAKGGVKRSEEKRGHYRQRAHHNRHAVLRGSLFQLYEQENNTKADRAF
jgi:hypothetical protein